MSPEGSRFSPVRLRQAREARKLSQTTLARHVGLSPQSVSLYEAGRVAPSVEVLIRPAS